MENFSRQHQSVLRHFPANSRLQIIICFVPNLSLKQPTCASQWEGAHLVGGPLRGGDVQQVRLPYDCRVSHRQQLLHHDRPVAKGGLGQSRLSRLCRRSCGLGNLGSALARRCELRLCLLGQKLWKLWSQCASQPHGVTHHVGDTHEQVDLGHCCTVSFLSFKHCTAEDHCLCNDNRLSYVSITLGAHPRLSPPYLRLTWIDCRPSAGVAATAAAAFPLCLATIVRMSLGARAACATPAGARSGAEMT